MEPLMKKEAGSQSVNFQHSYDHDREIKIDGTNNKAVSKETNYGLPKHLKTILNDNKHNGAPHSNHILPNIQQDLGKKEETHFPKLPQIESMPNILISNRVNLPPLPSISNISMMPNSLPRITSPQNFVYSSTNIPDLRTTFPNVFEDPNQSQSQTHNQNPNQSNNNHSVSVLGINIPYQTLPYPNPNPSTLSTLPILPTLPTSSTFSLNLATSSHFHDSPLKANVVPSNESRFVRSHSSTLDKALSYVEEEEEPKKNSNNNNYSNSNNSNNNNNNNNNNSNNSNSNTNIKSTTQSPDSKRQKLESTTFAWLEHFKDQSKGKKPVFKACVNCKKAHLACDTDRPCKRCVHLGKGDTCQDVDHKKRGRPKSQKTNSLSKESQPSTKNKPQVKSENATEEHKTPDVKEKQEINDSSEDQQIEEKQLLSVHTLDGKFTDASFDEKLIFGFEKNDLMKHTLFDFIHKDDCQLLRQLQNEILNSPFDKPKHATVRFLSKEGGYLVVEIVMVGVKNNTGKVNTIACSTRMKVN